MKSSVIPKQNNPTNLPQYDMTTICNYLHCPRYFYWAHERSISSTDVKLPLVYGISIHAMLAEWYKTKSLQSALVAFDQSWTKHGAPDGDEKRNPVRAADIMLGYKNFYDQEPFTVIDTEVVGAIPAGNFMLIVIIDLVINYPGYGYLPMDHKTASWLNEGWWSGMNPKHQYSAYLWAMRQLFGKNCNSLFVNGILIDCKRVNFERQPTSRNDWELANWLEQMNHIVDLINSCRTANIWPQSDDYCTRWGGGASQICQFHSICTQVGVDYRKFEPGSGFETKIWDPLNEER